MMQRSILITGCSSGIGYDCAIFLRENGWFEAPQIDYADPESIARGAAEVLKATGGTIDALFNNGAHAMLGALEDIPAAALRENLEVNVVGYHDLTRQVIPAMRAQGHGRILNCSSVLGIGAAKWRGPYNATKFALEGLTDTLRLEMRETPIHIILIQPGPIETKIRANAAPHFEKWVDWKSSARRAQYEESLLDQLYGRNQRRSGPQYPPRAASKKVLKALTDKRPATRFYVIPPTYATAALRRLLPRRAFDAVLDRF